MSTLQDVHWSELIASKDKETTSSTNSLEGITENERKRREAVWELFKSECVFLIDHLMVLKHVSISYRARCHSCSRNTRYITV